MHIFQNITWPEAVTYNIIPQHGSKVEGGADIEHFFIENNKKNVWKQKRSERVSQQLVEYAELAETRCCTS